MFDVKTFNTFEKWATLKFLHDNDKNDDLAITIAQLYSKQTS